MAHEGIGKAAEIDDLVNNPEQREKINSTPQAEDLHDYERWSGVAGAGGCIAAITLS